MDALAKARNWDWVGSWDTLSTLMKRSGSGQEVELPGTGRTIDARSIVTLIVFFVVNALVIFPLRIPLPLLLSRIRNYLLPRTPAQASASTRSESNRMYFKLGLETAPVVGVLLLLASTCIPGSVVRDGIVGSEGVRPYDIMTLFISFAYISISLDCTGLLQYLAYTVGSHAASSGRFLYFAFYSFFSITGLIIGNDPLILSGTPFLVYFTRHAHVDPQTAYLFTHFQASNLVSALLVSSNPTNLVLTSAFGISFLSYSAWLALPTIASIIVLFPLLRYVVFGGGLIPAKLNPPKVNPRDSLVDPWGGIFGASLFLVVIIALIALSAVGLLEGVEGVWTITAPAGIIMLLRDCVHDLSVKRDEQKRKEELVAVKAREMSSVGKVKSSDDEAGKEAAQDEKSGTLNGMSDGTGEATQEKVHQPTPTESRPPTRPASPTSAEQDGSPAHNGPNASSEASANTASETSGGHDRTNGTTAIDATPIPSPSRSPTPRSEPAPTGTPESAEAVEESAPVASRIPKSFIFAPIRFIARTFPTASLIFTRLPLPLIPFAFSMFILVEALQYTGWISVFAGWWAAWAKVGGVAGCVWLMGMLSVLGCNVFGTNIGATVLLSRILQQWRSVHSPVSSRSLYGAIFALAVGSNFGAYSFVFSASLAGLLWRDILGQKGLTISRKEFVRWNTVPVIVTTIVGCLVVAGEVCVMYKT